MVTRDMKTMLTAVVLAAALGSSAAVVELVPGSTATVGGGKLAHVEAISTVAAGTVSVAAESLYYTNGVEVVELEPVTNTTYQLVYMDGSTVVTNVTTSPVDFTYIGANYTSYTTNVVVTTPTVTNDVMLLALAKTNTVSSLTCASGVGSSSPEDTWLPPGAKVWFTGTAKGRVWLYIED